MARSRVFRGGHEGTLLNEADAVKMRSARPDSNGRSKPSARIAGTPSHRRRLRVLAVDSHELVLWGFRLLLASQPWVARYLAASSVDEAEELARKFEPHVAIVDL